MNIRLLLLPVMLLIAGRFISAQDNVYITEEQPQNIYCFFVPLTIVENQTESPLNAGAGFGFTYLINPFTAKPFFIGGELTYSHMASDRITYNNDEYLQSSAALWGLNFVSQYRLFRNNRFGFFPEAFAGLLMPGFSSTYYYYDYESDSEVGDLEKMRLMATPSAGIGAGLKLFEMFELRFRYSLSLPVKHFHPSDVTETADFKIIYPYVKKRINRFEIIFSISLK